MTFACINAALGKCAAAGRPNTLGYSPWRGGHQYLGFVEQHTDAAVAFDAATYARLASIRDRVDPQRRFVVTHDVS